MVRHDTREFLLVYALRSELWGERTTIITWNLNSAMACLPTTICCAAMPWSAWSDGEL